MKLGLISNSMSFTKAATAAAAATVLATAGCSGTANIPGGLTSPPGSQASNPDGGAPVQNAPPHALATIILGEAHQSGGTTSTPVVSASFIPDTSAAQPACTTTIDGCTIAKPAVCTTATGIACTANQICSLDANCNPQCVPACTAVCPSGQVCHLGVNGAQSCQATQTFDGGDIVFSGSGLAIPVTLLAPTYSFTSATGGSPFVPGGTINVTGTGTTGAGFAAFQESFTATTLLQTVPALSKLTAANVYNPAGFSLGWQPGSDAISILITGPLGSAQCAASDSAGTFTVPAAVVAKVSGTGNPGVAVSVTRQRVSEKTDGKTEGSLAGATVQPLGYIDLTTVSSESYEVEGCGSGTGGTGEGGLTSCTDGCVDLLSSATDCGTCGHSCGAGYCSGGACYGTTTSCTSPYTSCNGSCVNLAISAANCGDCGFACGSGQVCISGVCETSTSSCGSFTTCSDGCQDLMTSSTDCGECGNSCDGGTCSSGFCSTVSNTTCSSCESTAESGSCASYYSTCELDSECANYASCMSGCSSGDSLCESTCEEDYPSGVSEAENLRNCICDTACPSSCAGTAYCTEAL